MIHELDARWVNGRLYVDGVERRLEGLDAGVQHVLGADRIPVEFEGADVHLAVDDVAQQPIGRVRGVGGEEHVAVGTVDVGAAQLAMHSARELMGAHDVAAYSAALRAFLSPE